MIIQLKLRTVQTVGSMWYNDKIELYVDGSGSGHDENFNPIIPEKVPVAKYTVIRKPKKFSLRMERITYIAIRLSLRPPLLFSRNWVIRYE